MGEKLKNQKEPWLAVVLSSFWAGIGQIYAGRILRGIVLILIEIALHCIAVWSYLSVKCDILITVCFVLTRFVVWIWSLFDAHKCTRRINSEDFEIERKLSKDPWLVLFLSDLIPGIGHLYLRKWIWGIVFIVVTIYLLVAGIKYHSLCIALWAAFTTFVCFHSYIMTPIRRQKSQKLIIVISVAILCSHLLGGYTPYFFKTCVVKVYRITADSMKPTLCRGDLILARKSGVSALKQGDIIVFKLPVDSDIPYVKRVAALPGETVEIKDEMLFVDGQKIQRLEFEMNMYTQGSFGIEQPYKVPVDCVFLLGDNIENSEDSRFYGAIPKSDIIGKAYKIVWPLSRRGPIK